MAPDTWRPPALAGPGGYTRLTVAPVPPPSQFVSVIAISTHVAREKQALREVAARFRASLTSLAAREALAEIAFPLAPEAVIGGYCAIGHEIDPAILLARLIGKGHRIGLPVVVRQGEPLQFRQFGPGDELEPGARGTRVPRADAPIVVPQVVLVPLLAFDRQGYRLGYGGGYYDRTLRALRIKGPLVAIGVAYAGQEIDAVPHDGFDERLDMMLTERGLRDFRAP